MRLVGSKPHVALGALVLVSAGVLLAPSPAALAQDAGTPNRIKIEYIPPKNPAFQPIYDQLKERRVLERVQEIFSPVKLTNDLLIKSTECGMSNAWYQRPTLTICYEYLADILANLPEDKSPQGITRADAMAGQFYYVVFHEMGHALFDALNVPIFGGPEDAADRFATYMMLRLGKQDARRLIGGAAYTYRQNMQGTKVTAPLTAFSDIHGAPPQRFYNLLCIAYGADPQMFGDLINNGYLPQARAKGCRVEYGEVNFAFQQLIRPYLDQELAKAVIQKDWLPPDDLKRPDPPPPPPQSAQ
jgi:Putative metallopeptidase